MNLKINKDTFKQTHEINAEINIIMRKGNLKDYILIEKLVHICNNYKSFIIACEIIQLNKKKVIKMPKCEEHYESIIDNTLSVTIFKN